eukprot:4754070-Alexandrium_andersonii.AAC.1
MSASLVGSEMCIRDSVCTARAGHAMMGVPAGQACRALASEGVPGQSCVCLLYTSDAADDM